MGFILLGNRRIKESSIQEYEAQGESLLNQGRFYIELKISGKVRKVTYEREADYKRALAYLDRVLGVKEI